MCSVGLPQEVEQEETAVSRDAKLQADKRWLRGPIRRRGNGVRVPIVARPFRWI
jgi:hypothetical protein